MKKEAISHSVWEDLENRNENWDKLEGVPERVDELDGSRLILKNEIVNGDFSNGGAGYTVYSATNVAYSVKNTTLLPTAKYGGLRFRITSIINDKLYLRLNFIADISDRVVFRHWGTTTPLGAGGTGQIQIGSVVYPSPLNGNVDFVIGSDLSSGFKSITFKTVMVINLTQTFGAGNEPTKEEMDLLISQIGYIDGEITLTQTQLLNWNLELNRLKANKQQEAWITPTLLNGYTAGVFGVPQYMKDQFGFVHFRGSLNGGVPGQKAFDIIEGYRPPSAKIWVSNAGYDNFNTGFITTNGSFAPNRTGATGDTGLDQITYKVGA